MRMEILVCGLLMTATAAAPKSLKIKVGKVKGKEIIKKWEERKRESEEKRKREKWTEHGNRKKNK